MTGEAIRRFQHQDKQLRCPNCASPDFEYNTPRDQPGFWFCAHCHFSWKIELLNDPCGCSGATCQNGYPEEDQ